MTLAPEMIGLIGIVLLLVLLLMRVWVGAAMAIVGFLGLIAMRGLPQAFSVLSSYPFNELSNYAMTAIPMFTLMGMVIAETDMGKGLYRAAHRLVGHARGGLASATVVAAGVLGAITGSENVSTVILTKIAYPEMRELAYDDSLSTASIAAGSPLAIIIPPSMPMILYGILTEQSVGPLFIGGIVPGVVLILAFCAVIWLRCRINPKLGPRGPKYSFKEKLKGCKSIIPVIILFVIVLGSIYFGIATTTEAGAMGALGAIIIAICTKQFTRKRIKSVLLESSAVLGMVLMMLVGIYVFVQFIALSKIPFFLTALVTSMNVSRYVILLLVIIMYLIMGMLLPQMTIIILTVPIIYPAMMALGFDPIWFGVLVVMMQALGGITPPIGMVSFMVSGMSGVQVPKVFKGLLPLLAANIVVVFLICAFPQLVTWLPGLMK